MKACRCFSDGANQEWAMARATADPAASLRDDKQKGKQRQRQRRNTVVSPLRRQSAPPSVEMTEIEWAAKEDDSEMAGVLDKFLALNEVAVLK
jgi:hypothetical protein